MKLRPLRRLPGLCLYCGRPSRADVCGYCSHLPVRDPLVSSLLHCPAMDANQRRLRDGLRHDPEARRKAQRHGRQKGLTITIAAAELRRAGLDPDGPAFEYKVYPGKKRDGGMQLRFFRD